MINFTSRSPQLRLSSHRPLRRAFTLIEVIVAVTIVAIVAAVVAPRVMRYIGSSKTKVAATQVASIAQQVRLYMVESGMSRCPTDFDLVVLTEGEDPILDAAGLLDPWGNPFVLIVPGNVNFDFDVMSYGADGQLGGELSEDKDVVNGKK